MINSIEDLKRRIIYRSTYRGTKEMDTILTSFTKEYINELDEKELTQLSNLLDIDDENLYKYINDEPLTVKIENNNVSRLFKDFFSRK